MLVAASTPYRSFICSKRASSSSSRVRGSQKQRNAERTGRASLCINGWPEFRYVTIEGPARIDHPVSYETRLRLHAHYRGEEAALKAVADGAHERMVALKITPERWMG